MWILCYTVMNVKCFCFSTAHLNNIKIDHLSGQHKFDFRENRPFFLKALESVLSGSSLYPIFFKESCTEITTAVFSVRIQHYVISIRQCDTISSDTSPLFPVYCASPQCIQCRCCCRNAEVLLMPRVFTSSCFHLDTYSHSQTLVQMLMG